MISTQLQGLKEVVGIKEPPPVSVEIPPEKAATEGGGTVMKEEMNVETCCQCFVVESPPEGREIKEPLSAPF